MNNKALFPAITAILIIAGVVLPQMKAALHVLTPERFRPQLADKTGEIHEILSAFVRGQLFGILGMLLAVPVTAVLKVGLNSILANYRSTRFYTGS